jgi:hypothetical protein
MSHACPRSSIATLAALFVMSVVAIAPTSANASSRLASPTARVARTLSGADTGRVHLVRLHEEILEEEGAATGALPGRMRTRFKLSGHAVVGQCTIYTQGGTITGSGSAKVSGKGQYRSFRGSLTIESGTGRYVHAHGRAGLYGTLDTLTFMLVVQTTGTISY